MQGRPEAAARPLPSALEFSPSSDLPTSLVEFDDLAEPCDAAAKRYGARLPSPRRLPSEGTKIANSSDERLADQLLWIAGEPTLRQNVYERLGEYCHQCRNRLNSLKLGLYLALKQAPQPENERWTQVDRAYQDLEKCVDLVQTLFRPMVLSRVTLALDLLIEDRRAAWTRTMAAEGKALELTPPASRATASFDVERLGQALDLVVDWRSSDDWGGRSARLRWWADAGFAHVCWEESAGLQGRPDFEEPARGLARTWGLPILARVAIAHGGNYVIKTEGGWRLEIAWPSEITQPGSSRVDPS